MWPQPRAFPGLLGSAVEGRGKRSDRGTDRRMDRSCHLFFLFVLFYFIFYLQIFAEKQKQKILFYNVSINLYIM